ncbi:ROK family transcriptional regulator [Salinarimonas ramus]|uniref:NagC family transcriptional regulator n=1 Tax=Salinarimonas ramus TaxID=690164 RepID=A0A917V8L4_9HYPH|nr:ROK family transcriptional regulator [Salinarimonas ramus]GGK51692.1 NagC family transcriptional regulator [Salinarimonas ramus]
MTGTGRAADPSSIFEIGPSTGVVLDAVRRAGGVARSALPEMTLLSQQSVHRIAEDLLARGLLRSDPPTITGPGKPSPRLSLRPDGAFGLGVAVDTDRVRIAVVNLVGEVLHRSELTAPPNDRDAVRAAAAEALSDALARLALPRERVAGLGVSMQGFRQVRGNAFVPPSPLDGWTSVDVVATFAPDVDGPVYAENNANLGAVAELWAGAGRRYDTFAYLSLNHGFGGGLVLGGLPWHGAHGNAAEISSIYTPAEFADRPALSGLLEQLRANGLDVANVSALRTRYDPAWPAIAAWIARVTPALAQMIRALIGIVDPAAVIFGGEAPRDLRHRLIVAAQGERIDRYGRQIPGPELVVGEIDADPSVVGAALMPIRRRLFRIPPTRAETGQTAAP